VIARIAPARYPELLRIDKRVKNGEH